MAYDPVPTFHVIYWTKLTDIFSLYSTRSKTYRDRIVHAKNNRSMKGQEMNSYFLIDIA